MNGINNMKHNSIHNMILVNDYYGSIYALSYLKYYKYNNWQDAFEIEQSKQYLESWEIGQMLGGN